MNFKYQIHIHFKGKTLISNAVVQCSCEKDTRKHKFGGTKVCNAEEVRKHFVNPKIENEFFSYRVNYVIYN